MRFACPDHSLHSATAIRLFSPPHSPKRGYHMKISSALRGALVALATFAGLTSAHADGGTVTLVIYKAGWIIGGSGGRGGVYFHGPADPLSTCRLDPRPLFRRLEDGAARPGLQHLAAL